MSSDPYLQPAFPPVDRLRRAVWNLAWLVLCRVSPRPFFEWRAFWLRVFGARIGRQCHVYPSATIWAPWLLEMDDVACLGEGVEVYNPGGVRLGSHAIVSQGAYLCGATHDVHHPAFTYIAKPIELKAHAWVCARAIVLPGVTLGEGAVLAAGAVGTRHLGAWTIYGGNPAKPIGRRQHNQT